MRYEITVSGDIPQKYIKWLNGFEEKITPNSDSKDHKRTCFVVKMADQSQLRGLLVKLFDLNLELISFVKVSDSYEKGVKNG